MNWMQRLSPYIVRFTFILVLSLVFQSGLFLEMLFGVFGDVPELNVYYSIILVFGSLYLSPILGIIFGIYVYLYERRKYNKSRFQAMLTSGFFLIVHPLVTWMIFLMN